MIGSVWGLLLVGALLASSAMALMWLLQVRIRDASHVDVAWAVLIACCAIAYALLADGDTGHRVLAAALASLWGFRLGGYLLFNRVLGKEEDGRYQELRRRWAPNANRNFFVFFQAQALFVVFFSLPFAFISLETESGFGTLAWIGIAVWAIGAVLANPEAPARIFVEQFAGGVLPERCGVGDQVSDFDDLGRVRRSNCSLGSFALRGKQLGRLLCLGDDFAWQRRG